MASILVILFSVCTFLINTYACPPEDLIKPCQCKNHAMVCEGIKGQNTLSTIFERIGDEELVDFTLVDSEVDYIPVSAVDLNQIERLKIYDSTIGQLFETDPSDSENLLVHIELSNVTFQNGLIVSQIKPLQRLQYFIVSDTEIPVMEQEFSQSFSKEIKMVVLDNTKTRSINYAFVGKVRLEEVKISNSLITKLTRASFPFPANYLKGLTFDGNQIETLPDDIFQAMFKLQRVSLANNKISQVSEKVFGEIFNQLKFLFLQGNPINCDCSIKWLTSKDSKGKKVFGTCAEPPTLAGKKIIDLKPSDFSGC